MTALEGGVANLLWKSLALVLVYSVRLGITGIFALTVGAGVLLAQVAPHPSWLENWISKLDALNTALALAVIALWRRDVAREKEFRDAVAKMQESLSTINGNIEKVLLVAEKSLLQRP